jgi:hypothetical protein
VIKNDNLRRIERSKKHEMEHSILMAAKLISPVCQNFSNFSKSQRMRY